jgi:hypothetical protein
MINAFPQNSVAQNFRHETRAQTWRCDVLEKQLTIRCEPARVIEMAFEGGVAPEGCDEGCVTEGVKWLRIFRMLRSL